MSGDRAVSEWKLLREQFHALERENSDNIEDIFDAEFRRRFTELINQTAERNSTTGFFAWYRR
jgi:hypothetical protein